MAYFKCESSATDLGDNAYQCSTGWAVVESPSFTVLSAEQTNELLLFVVTCWGLIKLYNFLFTLMGVQR